MEIVLAVKPKYARRILDGTKTYEYRTSMPRKRVDFIYVYETAPTSAVVAQVKVRDIHEFPPDFLWGGTWRGAGMPKEEFDAYFKGRKMAYAYELGSVWKYKEPRPLSCFGLKRAPQSFAYAKGGNGNEKG